MRIAVSLLLLVVVILAAAVVLLLVWRPDFIGTGPAPVTASAPPDAAVAPSPPAASIESRFEAAELPPLDGDALRAELEAAIAAQRQPGADVLRQTPTLETGQPSIETVASEPAQVRVAMPTAASLADFPWPPPAPSAQAPIPATTFRTGAEPSLAEVGARLTSALDQAGIAWSFYRAPNGFALVSRLERIGEDGARIAGDTGLPAPAADRPFQFSATMAALATAPAGYYRVIAFVVSDGSMVPSARPLSESEAGALADGGAAALPDDFNDRPFTDAHFVTALIYEFRKGEAERDVATLYPGRFNGADHLRSAGLLRVIEQGG